MKKLWIVMLGCLGLICTGLVPIIPYIIKKVNEIS